MKMKQPEALGKGSDQQRHGAERSGGGNGFRSRQRLVCLAYSKSDVRLERKSGTRSYRVLKVQGKSWGIIPRAMENHQRILIRGMMPASLHF